MRFSKIARPTFLLILTTMSIFAVGLVSKVYADAPFSLNPVPAYAQEGTTISLVLTVRVNVTSTPQTYQFRFSVGDPAGRTFQSQLVNYTVAPGQDRFSLVVDYPGPLLQGPNSLVGLYPTWVDQLLPTPKLIVASSSFVLSITDNPSYERTQTVNLLGSGYNASENVGVTVRTQTTSTIVLSQTIPATSVGVVTSTWKIPRNGTIDNYVVTLTGTTTHKTPPDVQTFSVRAATMAIAGISSAKSTYQRTDTMQFSFQPTYPDGSISSTGVALLSLSRPSGGGVTLTATYNSVAQTFDASYPTSPNNQTGTWTVSLGVHGYSDAYGNTGPGIVITSTPQLTPATLSITVSTNPNIGVGQQLRFNATGRYPDGTSFQSGTVRAFLVYSGTPAINDTVPVVFDSGLGQWIGTYTARQADTGGLWSLIVTASDSVMPPNVGTATRAITIQNNTSTGIPLYWFGIIAAIISGILVAALLVFKRRRVTHARLKIDLEAVHSEAGRIESQDFFKTIKEQVRKEKED